MVLSLLHLKI